VSYCNACGHADFIHRKTGCDGKDYGPCECAGLDRPRTEGVKRQLEARRQEAERQREEAALAKEPAKP
jgi:hypothetical protein